MSLFHFMERLKLNLWYRKGGAVQPAGAILQSFMRL